MGDMETLRERRRAKILQNSDDRMKKLLGYKQLDDNNVCDTNITKADDSKNGDSIENLRTSEHFKDISYKVQKNIILSVNNISSNNCLDPSKIVTEVPNGTPTPQNEEATESSIKENSKLRFFVMLVAGILIRLILESSMNALIFKESIIYQFIILEIIMNISHRRQQQEASRGMDYFFMSHLLRFLGATERLNRSLLSVYTLWRYVACDFCMFMFTFMMTHYFCSLFAV